MRFPLLKYLFLLLLVPHFLISQNIDSLRLVSKNQQDTILYKSILKIGSYFYESGELDSALINYSKGLENATRTNNKIYVCNFFIKIGTIYREKGIYELSNKALHDALNIAEKNNFQQQTANCYNGIAIIYTIQHDYVNALENYNKSLAINKSIKSTTGEASIYNNIGLIYLEQKITSKALKYFIKALDLNKKALNNYGIATNSENIGLIYDEIGNSELAKSYLERALKIWYGNKDFYSASINLGYYGKALINEGQFNEAIDSLKKGLNYARKVNSFSSQKDLALYLNFAYESIKDYENALFFYKTAMQLSDSLQSESKTKEITTTQLSYGFNKIKMQDSIKHQYEVQMKEKQLSNEKNYKYVISSVLFLILILLFFVYKNYSEKKKANITITLQKNIVESKQKEILDSIFYAKTIQTALLTNENFIFTNLKESFIFFKPKDIVSGDFYWASNYNNKLYIAVCDSTGHGVPGAFMSLLNMNYIREAIKEKGIEKPNEIFDYVRSRLENTVNKTGHKDGMDGVLICYDKETNKIDYAAANNEPVIVRDNTILQLDKDKMPVGIGEKKANFTLFSITAKKDDTLYLYTDGYSDQFGGPKGKKYKRKQLNEFLLSMNKDTLDNQKIALETAFSKWKGDLEQVDDVCVIGIKI
jgi:serine phosphatase RsbU (regulator of sigma subunit)